MLKMETTIEAIEGKTIRSVGETDGGNVIIVFTDESFIWLKSKNGYDGCDPELNVMDEPERVLYCIAGIARELGVVTKEEYDAHDRKQRQLQAKRDE